MASTARHCYTRNGTLIASIAYQPCSNDTSHDSACCGTNHQGAGDLSTANDVCETNGLCQNYEAYDGKNGGVKAWGRQGCTDPTWQSEYCLRNVCNYPLWQVDNAGVQPCANNTWCCGEKSCCSVSSSLFQLAATVGPTSTSSSLIPVSSTSNISGLSPTITPSFAPDYATGGLSIGAKAGIGSGVAVAVILLAIIAVLAIVKSRNNTKEKQQRNGYAQKDLPAELPAELPTELHGENLPAEMGERCMAELQGEHGHSELPAGNSSLVDSRSNLTI